MGNCKSGFKGEVYNGTSLSRKQEKSPINNLTLHVKELEKEEQAKLLSQQKEGNYKDQSKNKID